jgi:hypothetical protein
VLSPTANMPTPSKNTPKLAHRHEHSLYYSAIGIAELPSFSDVRDECRSKLSKANTGSLDRAE